MAKRYYLLNIKCAEEGCNECTHYSYDTRKEYSEGAKRNAKWRCLRHSDAEKVLTKENKLSIQELIVMKSDIGSGLYWGDGKKCGSGFAHGNAYRAWAKDFPEGTILKITAEIILPNTTVSES